VAALAHLETAPSADDSVRLDVPRVYLRLDGRSVASVPAVSDPDEGHRSHTLWLVSFLPGRLLADLEALSPALLRGLGRGLGDLDRRLASFDDSAMRRSLGWNLEHAPEVLCHTEHIEDVRRRARVVTCLHRFADDVLPGLRGLPHQVIHNDANDHNVVVRIPDTAGEGETAVSGLLDFGDMVWTARACEPAVAMTYAMLEAQDPIAAASAVLEGYHEICPLEPSEIGVLRDLIEARLCVSVTMSAYGRERDPDNTYLAVSEASAWSRLDWLSGDHSYRLTEAFLAVCADTRSAGTAPRQGEGHEP
jgi:Ser/Thr protein kinase RdoA (MazF antagonist)